MRDIMTKTFQRFVVASFLGCILFTPLAAHARRHHHFVQLNSCEVQWPR